MEAAALGDEFVRGLADKSDDRLRAILAPNIDFKGLTPGRTWDANDVETLLQMRRLIDFLPSNNQSGVPELPTSDSADRPDYSLDTLIPDNPNKPYDIKELILKVVDEGDFFELGEAFAKNIVTGFGRIAEGRHWPLDVIASYIIGLGLLSGLIWLHSAEAHRLGPGLCASDGALPCGRQAACPG